jgi:hypothetical protein
MMDPLSGLLSTQRFMHANMFCLQVWLRFVRFRPEKSGRHNVHIQGTNSFEWYLAALALTLRLFEVERQDIAMNTGSTARAAGARGRICVGRHLGLRS